MESHGLQSNGSNDATVKTGQTAIWRKQDVEKIIRMIEDEGLEIAGEPCYAVGTDPLDLQPDMCATRCPTHPSHTDVMKIMLAGYPVTSLGFVITRPRKSALLYDAHAVAGRQIKIATRDAGHQGLIRRTF
ncbi:hypothetical protein NFJ02_32g81260 [Pycnococcus provasolii]